MIAKKYPLLAEQFAVTVDEEMERLIKLDEVNERYFQRLRVGNAQAWERGNQLRDEVRKLDFEVFTERMAFWSRWYGVPYAEPGELSRGFHWADIWHNALRRLVDDEKY